MADAGTIRRLGGPGARTRGEGPRGVQRGAQLLRAEAGVRSDRKLRGRAPLAARRRSVRVHPRSRIGGADERPPRRTRSSSGSTPARPRSSSASGSSMRLSARASGGRSGSTRRRSASSPEQRAATDRHRPTMVRCRTGSSPSGARRRTASRVAMVSGRGRSSCTRRRAASSPRRGGSSGPRAGSAPITSSGSTAGWRSSSTRPTPPGTRAGCSIRAPRSRATPEPAASTASRSGSSSRTAASRSTSMRPAAQYETGAALIAEVASRWRIPLDRDHVIGHREVFAAKDCPGNLDLERLIARARELAAGADAAPLDRLPAAGARRRRGHPRIPGVGRRDRRLRRRARRRQHRRDGRTARGEPAGRGRCSATRRRAGFAGWDDGENRSRLLAAAAELEPDWILFLDSDERLDGDDAAALREFLSARRPGGHRLRARALSRVGGTGCWRADPRLSALRARTRLRAAARAPSLQPGADRDPALGLAADDDPRPPPRLARAPRAPAAASTARPTPTASRPERPPRCSIPHRAARGVAAPGRPGLPVLAGAPIGGGEPAPARAVRARARLPAPGAQLRAGSAGLPRVRRGVRRRGRRPRRRQHRRHGRGARGGAAGRAACCATRSAIPTPAGTMPPTASGCSTPRSSSARAGCCSSTPTSGSTPATPTRCGASSSARPMPGSAYGFRVHRMLGDGASYDRADLWVYRLFAPQPGQRLPEQALHLVPVPTSIPRGRWQKTTVRIRHFAGASDDAAARAAAQVRGGRSRAALAARVRERDPRARARRGRGDRARPGCRCSPTPRAPASRSTSRSSTPRRRCCRRS